MPRPRTVNIRTTKEVTRKVKIHFKDAGSDEDGNKLDGYVTRCGMIVVDSNLMPSEQLSTLIHESLHMTYPGMPEEEVLRGEHNLFQILRPFLNLP